VVVVEGRLQSFRLNLAERLVLCVRIVFPKVEEENLQMVEMEKKQNIKEIGNVADAESR
jgi:hypothetical protein